MKKTINGRVCNTETATKIGDNQTETLYVTRSGVYFIFDSASEKIYTLGKDAAQSWAESYAADATKRFFTNGNNLKAWRRAAGLTQQQLADAAGIFVAHLQKLENGERKIENLQLHTAQLLANALGITTDDLSNKSAKTHGDITTVSTFSDFVKYSGVSQDKIKSDWKIPEEEIRSWMDNETSVPIWLIPMLIKLYNVGNRIEYRSLGSAVFI